MIDKENKILFVLLGGTLFIPIMIMLFSIITRYYQLNSNRKNMRFYDNENYYYCSIDVGSGKSSCVYCGAISKEDYEDMRNGIYGIIKVQCLGRNRYYAVNSINITNIYIYDKDDWLSIEFYD